MQRIPLRMILALSMLLYCISCQKEPPSEPTYEPIYPAGFPPIVLPADNASTAESKIPAKSSIKNPKGG